MAGVREHLTAEEARALCRVSSARGWGSVLLSWVLIALSFALVAWRPTAATILVALIVLGGRQLALAILMHEAAHRTLLRSGRLNDLVGQWLCAAPTWNRLGAYRAHHLQHHRHNGTDKDPDLRLVTGFPMPRSSLLRKFARDLTGLTALRRVVGQWWMDTGRLHYSASGEVRPVQPPPRLAERVRLGWRCLGPVLMGQALLFGLLFALGYAWLYLLWVLAYATTFSLFLRIRSMAEHACTDRSEGSDVFARTRTTQAHLLARLTVAPHQVNYHLEHHLLMGVPHYRLPDMHRLLRERGALDGAQVSAGYGPVLRQLTTA